jgi:hypothetical protein
MGEIVTGLRALNGLILAMGCFHLWASAQITSNQAEKDFLLMFYLLDQNLRRAALCFRAEMILGNFSSFSVHL